MKHIRFTALAVCLGLFLGLMGCAKESGVTSTVSGGRPTASIRDVSNISVPKEEGVREVVIDIPASNYWTFNDLHDFLENPQRNDQQPFFPDEGEYLVLYEADGKTVIDNWNTRLQDNMVITQHAADGTVICRFTVALQKDQTSSKPDQSVTLSVPTQPTAPSVVSKPTSQNEASDHASSDNKRPVSENTDSVVSNTPSKPQSSATLEPSGTGSSNAGQSQPEQAKTVITVACSKNNKALKAAMEAFNKQSKTVEVVRFEDATGIYSANRLEQALEQNNCPDLVLMSRSEMKTAQNRGLLLELSAAGVGQLGSLFHAAAWNNTAFDNYRYGLPVGCVTACLACNDDILFRCGVDVPKDFTTLVTYAQTVQKFSDDAPPIEIITNPSDSKSIAAQFIAMLWSFDGEFLSSDGKTAAFQSAAGLSALNVYRSLNEKQLIGDGYTATEFADGATAYGFVYSTEYSEVFGASARANFTAAPLVLPGKTAVSPLDVYSYCIPNTGINGEPEAAFAFLRYYFSDSDYSVAECMVQDWIPAMNRGLEEEYYQSPEWQILIDALDDARPLPALDFADTLYDYVADAVIAVLSGDDPKQALTKAETKVNNRLAR